MKGQSMRDSVLESAANIATGFVVSWLVWVYVVGPIFGYDVGLRTGFAVTFIFTITSYIRSLVWRRAFNWWMLKQQYTPRPERVVVDKWRGEP